MAPCRCRKNVDSIRVRLPLLEQEFNLPTKTIQGTDFIDAKLMPVQIGVEIGELFGVARTGRVEDDNATVVGVLVDGALVPCDFQINGLSCK